MQAVRSPNRWSCLACSFASVLDLPLDLICKAVGHDGSAVVWPRLPEPERRRGFHIQEMLELAYYSGFFVMPFEAIPIVQPDNPACKPYVVEMVEGPGERLSKLLDGNVGVLTGETLQGKGHAVAWNGSTILDPGGSIRALDEFVLRTFWLVQRIRKTDQ